MAFCRSGCFRCLPLPHDQVLQVRNSTLFLRCPELPYRQFPGPPAPELDFSAIPGKVDAYNLLIEIHYRHYQFYALCRTLHKAYYADLLIMRSC